MNSIYSLNFDTHGKFNYLGINMFEKTIGKPGIDRLAYMEFAQRGVYKILIRENFLNDKYMHTLILRKKYHNKKVFNMGNYYLEEVWNEKDSTIDFIRKKALKEYASYPLVGNYDVDPDIFDPEISKLMYMDLEDED